MTELISQSHKAATFADVLVIGGGMAGAFAALAAKFSDNTVVLVEPFNVLGGQGTAGGVTGFCGDAKRVNDSFDKLVARLARYDLIDEYDPVSGRMAYHLEYCAYFLQEMLTERGVQVFLHSHADEVQCRDGLVEQVRVSTPSETLVFRPSTIIDATGSCVVAHRAGFETFHEPADKQLPLSLVFTLWDTGRMVQPFLPDHCPRWESDDELPMTSVHEFDSGKVEVKMKVTGFDAADGASLSQAEFVARRQMMGLIYYLQTRGYRGKRYDTHELACVSRTIGIREQRRIVGEYVLTDHDCTHSMVFDDAIAVGTYHFDYHWPDRPQRDGTGINTPVEPYHIPARCLIPRGAKNLLVAGRGASGEQLAMSSYRVMTTCVQMGTAAGKIARHAAQTACDVKEVPIPSIQRELIAENQSLDLSDYGESLRQDLVIREHIFGDDRPFASCHASTLVQLTNNRFLVAWFGGSAEGKTDVGIWMADRFCSRWSAPRQIAKTPGQINWNPVLFRTQDGTVHLFYKGGKVAEQWQTWTCASEDDGKTWSKPRLLVEGDCGGRGPVKNKPIILSDGAWLAAASIESDERWDAFVDRSTDGGRTWHASELLDVDRDRIAGRGVIQPALWESRPGHVHMLLRSTCGKICRSDSEDYGRTWSPVELTDLPNNNSGIDVAKLHDGTLALVYNPISVCKPSEETRSPLSVALSFDNGSTWPRRLDIETGPGEFSYPAIIPVQRGMAITYTWRRERIAFWSGSIENIPALKAHSTAAVVSA